MGKSKIALFTLVIWTAALVLGEGIVRAVYALQDELPPTADPSQEEEWQWARSHLAAGGARFLGEGEFDSELGWRMRPLRQEDGLRTNSVGMRGSREFAQDPPPQTKRLLLVGDSYTFGVGVRDEDTFAEVLARTHLPGWEVLNLAVSGYGTDQQVLSFERVGRQYHPDVVVLGFFVRDYDRNLLTFRSYAKPRFALDGSGGITLVGSPVIDPETLYAEYASGRRRIECRGPSYLFEFMRERLGGLARHRIHEGSEGWLVLAEIMRRFRDEVRASGAEPVWVLIPSRDVVEEGRDRFAPLEKLVAERAEALDLAYLSLSEDFVTRTAAAPAEPLYQSKETSGHLSPAGHRVAAESIASLLRARGWLERPQAESR